MRVVRVVRVVRTTPPRSCGEAALHRRPASIAMDDAVRRCAVSHRVSKSSHL
jgi:hypothetical protein